MRERPPGPNEGSHGETLRSRLRTTLPSGGEAPDYLKRIAELRESLASEEGPQSLAGVTQDTSARRPRNPLAIAAIRWVGVAAVIILAVAAGTERAMVRSVSNRAPAGPWAQQPTTQAAAGRGNLGASQDVSDARVTATPKVSSPSPKLSSSYHVQVGAFNVRKNARELIQKLESNSYSGRIVEFPQPPRYRVWVGDFPDRSDAERLAASLRASGFDASVLPP